MRQDKEKILPTSDILRCLKNDCDGEIIVYRKKRLNCGTCHRDYRVKHLKAYATGQPI